MWKCSSFCDFCVFFTIYYFYFYFFCYSLLLLFLLLFFFLFTSWNVKIIFVNFMVMLHQVLIYRHSTPFFLKCFFMQINNYSRCLHIFRTILIKNLKKRKLLRKNIWQQFITWNVKYRLLLLNLFLFQNVACKQTVH